MEPEFDEYDPDTMLPLVSLMLKFAEDIFPSLIEIEDKKLYRHIAHGSGNHVQQAITLVDECMGKLYVSHKGRNWKKDKAEELEEVGLLFVWYSFDNDVQAPPRALVVSKITESQTLYLYEIQVHPEVQGKNIGSKLMKGFHDLALKLDDTSLNDTALDETTRWNCTVEYTGLTVFSDNKKALNWYRKMGYDYSPNSPRDRKTRLRVIKPDYYELEREVNH